MFLKLFLARKDKCMNVSVTKDTKDAHRCGFYVWGCVDLLVFGEVEIEDGFVLVELFFGTTQSSSSKVERIKLHQPHHPTGPRPCCFLTFLT